MFSGYIAAVVTPFKNNQVDFDGFGRYINWLADSGISGIVVCGSTGESWSISLEEQINLVKFASDTIQGKIKVIGGVISPLTEKCVNIIKNTENYVDGFLCICPFYIKPSQEQVVHHFHKLSDSTSKPIILYNNPGRVATDLGDSAFDELVKLKNVVAIKECSTDLSRFILRRQNLTKNFDFLSGNDDSAVGALAMGASGVVSVSANVCPKLCVATDNSFIEGDWEKFKKCRDLLAPLHSLMFSEPSPAPAKYALSKMGFIQEEIREPLSPISRELKLKIDSYMERVSHVQI